MTSRAFEHYLEHAAKTHLPQFEAWFPSSFDWLRLCADVPTMARRAGHEVPGLEEERRLEEMAAAVFQAAHLLVLALLCASAEGPDDPDSLLDRLAERPALEEEDVFDDLVAENLGAVEEHLAAWDDVSSGSVAAGAAAEVEQAIRLVLLVSPAVQHAMTADASGTFAEAGESADVLWSISRLAAILGAFRWMAAEREAPDWPRIPVED